MSINSHNHCFYNGFAGLFYFTGYFSVDKNIYDRLTD